MKPRLILAALALAASCGIAAAGEPARDIPSVTTEAAGDTVSACLTFAKPVARKGDVHPGDYLSLQPAARPAVTVKGDRLCLAGLHYGTRYSITVRTGLAFADGSRQANDETAVVDPLDRDPMVAVSGRGWILPRKVATGVTVQTINVPLVRIRVLRVSERTLAASTTTGDQPVTAPDPAKQSFRLYDLRQLANGATTVIWSGTMRTNPGRNRTVETAFPLANIVDPSKPGAYLVLAEDAARPAVKLAQDDTDDTDEFSTTVAGHWVLSTDLALSSLQGLDGLHVTVRSFASAAPLQGVRLQVLSVAQDVLAEATTDANGAATFAPGLLRGKHGAAEAVLLARTDAGDMAVQNLAAPAFDLSDRGAGGRVSPGPIEAYVYTDRGIYRPGETVQAMALLRTHGLAAVDNAPLTIILRRPDGVEASRVTLPPAPDAGFHAAIKLTATAAQGTWTVEAYVDPTLPPIGRASVGVQDFVPQQLKVSLTGPAHPLGSDAHLTAAIDGRFLYGAPAAGLHAEGDVKIVRDEHPVPDAKQYSFGIPGETIPDAEQPLKLDDADAAGHVGIDATLQIPPGVASPLMAVVNAGLTEPSGRAVRETVSVGIRNHPLLIGIRKLFGDRLDEGSVARFAVRLFDADAKPEARAGLTWRVVREDRHWNWWRGESGNDGWTFHYYTTEADVAQGTFAVTADRPAELTQTLDWGDYRMIVSAPSGGARSSVAFSVGWGGSSMDTDLPDRLEVSTDRAVAGIGQIVHVHLHAPFAGAANLIVENAGHVLETRRIDLPRDGATIDLTASDAWGAGVHVLAEAFRPLNAPSGPHDPVRAVGLAWVATDPVPHTLAVSIDAPQMVTPRQTMNVRVHVAGGHVGAHGKAFITLAAVDEGILQLTHFATPDPVATLLGRTRFALDLRDDYGRLLDGHADVGALQEGGDEGAALGGAGLPVTTTRVVALFHGPIEVDANGDATVPLDLPDFAGELRLMAVAYDHDAAGHAERAMTVRDPVVADVALPRFLAPDDVAGINVSLHDTDGPAGSYHLALTASGAAAWRGVDGLDVHLAQGERRNAHLELVGKRIGIGHLEAVLTGPGGLRIAHEWDIAVRSPHPDLVLSRTDTQAPGATYTVAPDLFAAFLPGSAHVTIGYSAIGAIDVPGLLQSLYTYPYGCTEQLSSSAFPLLYFSDARLLGRPAGDPAVHERVQQAIDTISDRQDATGRFGLWHVGDGAASTWLNVYALDFLLHAREAGFKVSERVTASGARWIDRQLDADASDDSGAYAQPPQPTRAYAAYVLARTSRIDPSRLRVISDALSWQGGAVPARVSWRKSDLAAPLSLAQLAGAQSLMGLTTASNQSFALALANLDETKVPDWWYNAYFWSPLRDEAGVLAVAAETGHDAVAASLLERLDRRRLDPETMNTQEKAWLLMAAHALIKHGTTRTLSIDGGPARTVPLPYAVAPAADAVAPQGAAPGGSAPGETTPGGTTPGGTTPGGATPGGAAPGTTVRNMDDKPVFRTVTVRGTPLRAPPALSNGFKLSRRTFTLTGDPLDDTRLRQTDRFIVVLSGSVNDGAFRRAVVVDPLPAGLEIEAPILHEDAYPFLGQLTHPRALEKRDDRFVAAFDVGSKVRLRDVDDDKAKPLGPDEFRIAYIVRAVTPGHFVRPETVVQDMYRPAVMARTTSGEIDVTPR